MKAGITLLAVLLALVLPRPRGRRTPTPSTTARRPPAARLHRGAEPGERRGRPGFACPACGVASGPPTASSARSRGSASATACRPTRASRASCSGAPSPCRRSGTARCSATRTCSRREPRRACWTRRRPVPRRVGDGRDLDRVARSRARAGHRRPDALRRLQPRPVRAGATRASMLRRLDAELSDRLDPTLTGAPSGDLLDPQRAVAGMRSVAFSATRPRRRRLPRDARGRRRGGGQPGRRRQRRPLPRAVHGAGAVPAHRLRDDRARHGGAAGRRALGAAAW